MTRMSLDNSSDIPTVPKTVHNLHSLLRVEGWKSHYQSVNNLLLHLSRKSKSEGTRKVYLWHLHKFCEFTSSTPAQLISCLLYTSDAADE